MGADIDAKHEQLEAEMAALKRTNEYIDAERVVKGLAPKHGHFVKSGQVAPPKAEPKAQAAAPAAAEAEKAAEKKDDKKKDSKKKTETAGISPAERQELEKLKADIIEKKASLKESGMSGGQIN